MTQPNETASMNANNSSDILVSEAQPPAGSTQVNTQSDSMDEQWLNLERQVHELIELTTVLTRENRALRAQQSNWTGERAKLIEKNELAKSRVESMITRLKALEND